MHKLPEHGSCFVCGTQNPNNMGVTWYLQEDGKVQTNINLTKAQQGPPNLAHGGASAALLDEAMGASVWQAGYRAAAVNLNVNFHHPLPLGLLVTVTGWVQTVSNKKILTQGEIRLPDGMVAVTAEGIYVVAPQLFSSLINQAQDNSEMPEKNSGLFR